MILQSEEIPIPIVEKSVVIFGSSTKYDVIKTMAENASNKLKIKLDLRGLVPNKKTGLTFDKNNCLAGPIQEFPCYQARGKFDDGEYISIEYSSEYKEMRPGFYIAIMYSGEKKQAQEKLKKLKPIFKDAYIKTIKIFMAGN